jgi:hypothetical protein
MKLMELIMKLIEGRNNKKLYGLGNLNQEQLHHLQGIIDKWTEESLQKRRLAAAKT